jgi:hypothetical protein
MKTTGTLAIELITRNRDGHHVFGAVAGDCLYFRLNILNYLFLFIFIFPHCILQSFYFFKNTKNQKIKNTKNIIPIG